MLMSDVLDYFEINKDSDKQNLSTRGPSFLN